MASATRDAARDPIDMVRSDAASEYQRVKRHKQNELSSRRGAECSAPLTKAQKKKDDNHASAVASRYKQEFLLSRLESLLRCKLDEAKVLSDACAAARAVAHELRSALLARDTELAALRAELAVYRAHSQHANPHHPRTHPHSHAHHHAHVLAAAGYGHFTPLTSPSATTSGGGTPVGDGDGNVDVDGGGGSANGTPNGVPDRVPERVNGLGEDGDKVGVVKSEVESYGAVPLRSNNCRSVVLDEDEVQVVMDEMVAPPSEGFLKGGLVTTHSTTMGLTSWSAMVGDDFARSDNVNPAA